jgi:hypothetical protein
MSRFVCFVGAIVLGTTMLVGCGGDVPKVQTYEVKNNSGLDQAKRLLQAYSQGQPVGSESTDYGRIVEEVKKTDPQKAAILEKGFSELPKAGAALPEKAKALLQQL